MLRIVLNVQDLSLEHVKEIVQAIADLGGTANGACRLVDDADGVELGRVLVANNQVVDSLRGKGGEP